MVLLQTAANLISCGGIRTTSREEGATWGGGGLGVKGALAFLITWKIDGKNELVGYYLFKKKRGP